MNQIRIPRDSNLRFVPMMYFLPQDLIVRCSTLRKLPRCFGEILQSDELRTVVESDQFLLEIMDSSAALAFRHFGFRGWKEHYTGYCPVWQLSYSMPLWVKLLEKEIGFGLQAVYEEPFIPFFKPEYIIETMSRVVRRAIDEQGWQPILNAVRKMPCDEDFEPWDTRARRGFHRKWYHTRWYEKRELTLVSLEDCMADEEDKIHEIAADPFDTQKYIDSKDYVERFKALLSPKDKEIITLRAHGHTYEKIAKMLGYKNHSGVIKKIRHIRKIFEKFEENQ